MESLPILSTDTVELITLPSPLNQTLISKSSFSLNAIVFTETPLATFQPMSTNDTDYSAVHEYATSENISAHYFSVLKTFSTISPSLQTYLLSGYFYSPSENDPLFVSSNLPPIHAKVVAWSQSRWPALQSHSVSSLKQLLRIIDTNSHFFGDTLGSSSSSSEPIQAIFPLGSKLNHSCEGNTGYSYDAGSMMGVHRARRIISPGDHLTTDYLGFQTFLSTPARLRVLRREKFFTCTCTRCTTGKDLCRLLPCPSCFSTAWNSQRSEWNLGVAFGRAKGGYIVRDNNVSEGGWVCGIDQKHEFSDDALVAIFGTTFWDRERDIEEILIVFDSSHMGFTTIDWTKEEREAFWTRASRLLGAKHWVTARIYHLIFERILADFRAQKPKPNISQIEVSDLIGRAEKVWMWYEAARLEPAVYLREQFLGLAEALMKAGWLAEALRVLRNWVLIDSDNNQIKKESVNLKMAVMEKQVQGLLLSEDTKKEA